MTCLWTFYFTSEMPSPSTRYALARMHLKADDQAYEKFWQVIVTLTVLERVGKQINILNCKSAGIMFLCNCLMWLLSAYEAVYKMLLLFAWLTFTARLKCSSVSGCCCCSSLLAGL